MKIEWDEVKRLANRRKHGVDFVAAVAAFEDTNGIEANENVAGEERWRLIAMAPAGLFHVVYTERGKSIRIISVRKATRREAQAYHSSEAG